VPLKARQTIVGAVTVDRNRTYPLTEDDVSLMVTFVNQLAIALDNADAYQAIEGLNLTLEAKVHERTVQLEIANEQLREHDRRKNQFLSHVSHDLKTPLTSIVGFIGNMLDGLAGPLQPKQHTYLERVKANAERLSRMISDLLDLSRILFGALHIHRASMSLNELAQETLDQLQLIADRKSVTLQLQCPHGPITVFADRDRLNQVVTNLLDNPSNSPQAAAQCRYASNKLTTTVSAWPYRIPGAESHRAPSNGCSRRSFRRIPWPPPVGKDWA